MDMIFLDNDHQRFYTQMVEIEHAEQDVYRQTLFYTLGLTDETRSHIKDLYDFNHHGPIVSGLRRGWQTDGSRCVTKMAFNLYNGYAGHDGKTAKEFTPYELFDSNFMRFFFEAVKLCFPASWSSGL